MLAGSQSALLVLSHNMSDSFALKNAAFAACKESYTAEDEVAAVEAVEAWLKHADNEEKRAMLVVASKEGYPKVVEELLKDTDFVKFELRARARELDDRSKVGDISLSSSGFIVRFPEDATPSGFTSARRAAKGAAEWAKPKTWSPEEFTKFTEWKCKQVRCTSCYDMLTLYTYIGEEIPDVATLVHVIDALRELGWETMDDIQDHWGNVSDSLREKKKNVERPLVNQLSEARYNYGSWNKQFKDEDKPPKKDEDKPAKLISDFCLTLHLCWMIVYATVLSLIVFVPIIVLIFYYELVHYEEQLWSECFVWLGLFALAQFLVAFCAAPSTGWGMIKESSRDADLGVTLRGSMNMQGLVSTFLFATIMGRLQASLRFDLTNNVTEVSSFDTPSIVDIIGTRDIDAFDYTFAEHALAQWYAVPYMHMHMHMHVILNANHCRTEHSQVPGPDRPCGHAVSSRHHHHHHLQDPHRAP